MAKASLWSFILWLRRGFLAIFLEGNFSLSLQSHWLHLTFTGANPGILSFSRLAIRQGFFLRASFICFRV
jgi:hypothetical protein